MKKRHLVLAVIAVAVVAGTAIAISLESDARAILSTSLTQEQRAGLGPEYTSCIMNSGGYESITQDDVGACNQMLDHRTDKFRLENYYATEREHRLRPDTARAITSTPLTEIQRYEVSNEYFLCVVEGGGYESITRENLDSCDQARYDHVDELMLENHAAQSDGRAQPKLEHAFRYTLITSDPTAQEIVAGMILVHCVNEGGGFESITQEDMAACRQAYQDCLEEIQPGDCYPNQGSQ